MNPTIAKTTYVYTSADVSAGYAVIPIVWRTRMNGDYVINWAIEDRDAAITLDYFQGDMHGVTPNGFNAVVYAYAPGDGTAGDIIVVHATAWQWNGGA